ncbi:twin transmembrane helix small protein [Sulfuritalea sp.]|uniref:twin transmembrane helix small protein n=1 Tax=Sulfuritalea sp. TaxID=2480090 RepID=UPI00286E4422|nr:twin transmembrane helix small protein [Sulfuritalea sp.]
MRFIVIALLIAIVLSLASALLFVYRDSGQSADRAVKALTLRVALSVLLFLVLIGGHYFGWISGHL